MSAAALGLLLAGPAYASGSSMPWEAPLQSILDSIQGPVAKIIADTVAEFEAVMADLARRYAPARA